ncbi:TetR/AcrR family transcriptional regulator [Bariatricus sp. SGI.154]|uniref:TetR/AcrR family transcriptional regulator n=1 Tax=Bariatricus sp. SGI.154 TaxID=3420549 RepID=UPI003D003BB1
MNKNRKNQANALARECMVTALIQLLKEKPLSAISVCELTEKAGVSRMTYYRNYHSKEDIFSTYLEDILIGYQEEARQLPLNTQCYESAHMLHCFSYFEKHKEFLDSLFQSGLGHMLLTSISKYVLEMWHAPEDGIEHYYGLQAFAGALYNLYISWASNGMRETPEELTKILEKILLTIRNHN